MRILITGSRHWMLRNDIQAVIADRLAMTRLVDNEVLYVRHGDNPNGADKFAKLIVQQYNQAGITDIVEEPYPADWDEHGKAAGPIRNQQMLDDNPPVDEIHAFPLQDSRGTVDMMKRGVGHQIPTYNYGWPFPIEGVIDVKKSFK